MSKDQKKSRNRLADLLFLGGGLSVVAVIVTYQTGQTPDQPPVPEPTAQVQQATRPQPSSSPVVEASPGQDTTKQCLEDHTHTLKPRIVDRDPFVNQAEASSSIAGLVALPEADDRHG